MKPSGVLVDGRDYAGRMALASKLRERDVEFDKARKKDVEYLKGLLLAADGYTLGWCMQGRLLNNIGETAQ